MRYERELLKGVAPMAVLEVLSHGALYGYQLSRTLATQSGDLLTLGLGSLYPLLYNLEAKGLARSQTREAENGRMRRYYALTPKGKRHLARQRKQWASLQKGVGMILGAGEMKSARGVSVGGTEA